MNANAHALTIDLFIREYWRVFAVTIEFSRDAVVPAPVPEPMLLGVAGIALLACLRLKH